MCESMHLYSSRSSFLSDCSSFFTLSSSYSNSAVKEYYDRIHSCMNHLTSLAIFFELSISSLISSYLVHRFCRAALCSANLLQCVMTCSAVSLIWLHGQTDDEKPEMRAWSFINIKNSNFLALILKSVLIVSNCF